MIMVWMAWLAMFASPVDAGRLDGWMLVYDLMGVWMWKNWRRVGVWPLACPAHLSLSFVPRHISFGILASQHLLGTSSSDILGRRRFGWM
jgi:hypothetical protein